MLNFPTGFLYSDILVLIGRESRQSLEFLAEDRDSLGPIHDHTMTMLVEEESLG